jgi:Transglutaminase-like superfamily
MSRVLAAPLLLCLFVPPLPARDVGQGSLRDYVLKSQVRLAYGEYIRKTKVGWKTEEMKLGRHDGKEVAVVVSESYETTLYQGTKTVSQEKTTVCYSLEGDGPVVFAEAYAKEDGKETTRKAVRKGDGLRLTVKTAKRTTERTIPVPKDTLAMKRRFDAWVVGPRKKGDTFTVWDASWEEDDVDVPQVYTFQEKKTVAWDGAKVEAYAVQIASRGTRSTALLRGDGNPLVLTTGIEELRLEKEAVARKVEPKALDLQEALAVRIDKDLGHPTKVERLLLKVEVVPDTPIPQSHRQRLRTDKEGTVLELLRDHRHGKPAPLSPEERAQHLKATATIQSDHEAIRTLARKIVRGEKGPVKAARLLQHWVFRNIKASYTDNADNALAVLDNKAGDCTEYSLLFVALARASGIPARQIGGLVYSNDGKPAFEWHAWAEIHDGSQWVSVDPTLNQVWVDAAHLKLSEGAQDLSWVNLVGKLKMKVVKFETKK